jgi:hypothetical protein
MTPLSLEYETLHYSIPNASIAYFQLTPTHPYKAMIAPIRATTAMMLLPTLAAPAVAGPVG